MPSWLALPLNLTLLSYLDPGMGSYALQILLATLFGGMFALKQSWAELKGWFLGRFGDSSGSGKAPKNLPEIEILSQQSARPGAHGQSTAKV